MVDSCKECFLIELGTRVKPSTLVDLRTGRQIKTFKKKDVIFEQGTIAKSICCSAGKVNSVFCGVSGKNSILFPYDARDLFPMYSIFKKYPLQCSYVAAEDAPVCHFPIKNLNHLIGTDNELTKTFLEMNSLQEIKKQRRLSALLVKSARLKIAHAISLHKNKDNICLLTRGEIADWTNLTIETVIRALSALERKKLIKRHRRGIQITDDQNFQKFLED